MNNEINPKILTINLEYAKHPTWKTILLVIKDKESFEIIKCFLPRDFKDYRIEQERIYLHGTIFEFDNLELYQTFYLLSEEEVKENEKLVSARNAIERALLGLVKFCDRIREIESFTSLIQKANSKNIIQSIDLRIKITPLSFDNQFTMQAFEACSSYLKDNPQFKPELIDYYALKALILNSDYNNYKGFEIIPIDEDQSFLLHKKNVEHETKESQES